MICQKDKCTGCYACYNICHKKAISFNEDDFGFIYPHVDKEKCIDCGLCKKICPQINDKLKMIQPNKVYAAYSNDNQIREKSTSGGLATIISKEILSQGGVVYGAANLFEKKEFEYIRIDDEKKLYTIQGSKYVHCYVKDAYINAKGDLLQRKKVLFIGTPCQIAGLKAFLMKEYDNLYTIDIICHGVPSQKLLFEDLKYNNIAKKNFDIVRFRNRMGYNLSIYKNKNDFENNNPTKSIYANLDYFFKNFLRGNIFRENCYSCKYANDNRISDITLGDFWGLNKDSKAYDDERLGISVVICNNIKGEILFSLIKNEITFDERTYDEAKKFNEQLKHPMKKSKQYYIFRENYLKKGFLKTMKKMNLIKDYLKYNKLYLFIKNMKNGKV